MIRSLAACRDANPDYLLFSPSAWLGRSGRRSSAPRPVRVEDLPSSALDAPRQRVRRPLAADDAGVRRVLIPPAPAAHPLHAARVVEGEGGEEMMEDQHVIVNNQVQQPENGNRDEEPAQPPVREQVVHPDPEPQVEPAGHLPVIPVEEEKEEGVLQEEKFDAPVEEEKEDDPRQLIRQMAGRNNAAVQGSNADPPQPVGPIVEGNNADPPQPAEQAERRHNADPPQPERRKEVSQTALRDWCVLKDVNILTEVAAPNRKVKSLYTLILEASATFYNVTPTIVTDGRRKAFMDVFGDVTSGDLIIVTEGHFDGAKLIANRIQKISKCGVRYLPSEVDKLEEYAWQHILADQAGAVPVEQRPPSDQQEPVEAPKKDEVTWQMKQDVTLQIANNLKIGRWEPGTQFDIVQRLLGVTSVEPTADFIESRRLFATLDEEVRSLTHLLIPGAKTDRDAVVSFVRAATNCPVNRPEDGNYKADSPQQRMDRMVKIITAHGWKVSAIEYRESNNRSQAETLKAITQIQELVNRIQRALLSTRTLLGTLEWSELIRQVLTEDALTHLAARHPGAGSELRTGLEWLGKAIKAERKALQSYLNRQSVWNKRPSEDLAEYLVRVQLHLNVTEDSVDIDYRHPFTALTELRRIVHPDGRINEVAFKNGGFLNESLLSVRRCMLSPSSSIFKNLWGTNVTDQETARLAALDSKERDHEVLNQMVKVMQEGLRADQNHLVPAVRRGVAPNAPAPAGARPNQGSSNKKKAKRQAPPASTSPARPARTAKADQLFVATAEVALVDGVTVAQSMCGVTADGHLDNTNPALVFSALLMDLDIAREDEQAEFLTKVMGEAEQVALYAAQIDDSVGEVMGSSARGKKPPRLNGLVTCFHCGNTTKQKPHCWFECDWMSAGRTQTREGRTALEEFQRKGRKTQYTSEVKHRLNIYNRMKKCQSEE